MVDKKLIVGGVLAAVISSCACSDAGPLAKLEGRYETEEIAQADPSARRVEKATSAVAIVKPLPGNKVRGKVTFTKLAEGVKVVADFDGLSPGQHGFHVHEHGSCGGEEASEAGAHFNPTNQPHGAPDKSVRHVGDLGNLFAGEDGHAHYERVDRQIALEGKNSIIGRSIIVHLNPDDYETQPAGASGAKIACGIIESVLNE